MQHVSPKQITFFVLLMIGIAYAAPCFSQGTVEGRVHDASSGESLPFANVFVNNTTIGVNADENGNFVLKNIPLGTHDLIVSYVGHQDFQTRIEIKGTVTIPLVVKLMALEMKAVEVQATRDKEWEKQFQKFKKLFLSNTGKEDMVKIVNPYGLNFHEDDESNFSASCPEVLEIENYILGYYVSYQMRSFVVTPSAYNIVGNVHFREMQTTDPQLQKRWRENRNKAYEGSYRHLFKSIIDGKFDQSGFDLFEDIPQSKLQTTNVFYLNLDHTVTKYFITNQLQKTSDGFYKLSLPKRIEVHYKNKSAPSKYYKDVACPVSWIENTDGYFLLTKDGIVMNYWMMTVSGDMTYSRVAEMLPNDYKPSEFELKQVLPPETINPYRDLMEKPYVQTDRSCYYPNDVIWFKTYMNYPSRALKDSLSHVLYVELVNANNKVVSRKITRLTNGSTHGSIDVLPDFVPGNYYLRAYTQWMLNFSPSLIFTRPLKILSVDQIIRHSNNSLPPVDDAVKISTTKEIYSPREKIELQFMAFDSLTNPVTAELSVSVTDVSQAGEPENEKNILTDFQIKPQHAADLPTSVQYRLQDGIDIKGKFVNKKGEGEESIVNVVQKNSGYAFTAPTSNAGQFTIENLDFSDSVEFVFQAKSLKDGKQGKIVFDSVSISPTVTPPSPLKLEIVTESGRKGARWTPAPFMKAITLKEVTVEANKIVDTRTPIKKSASYSISGEWFRATNARNVVIALQGRIPGLNILTFMDGKSNPFQVVMFQMRHVSFFPGGPGNTEKKDQLQKQEPLILINDVVVNYELGDGARYIQMLTPEQIDRIDVYRSSAYGNYGPRGSNGVISIYTRNPIEYLKPRDVQGIPVQTFKAAGFSTTQKFKAPQYDRTDTTFIAADYRATIFWEPSVIIKDLAAGASVNFFAADIPSKYKIVVEGVAADGTPLRGEKIIEVKTKD